MWFLTLLLFIFILGLIVLVHELGHFLWAKKFGVYIYEFSIGMGPVIYTKKGKDGINYNIRAFPIGGFVSMAGEVYEDDDEVKENGKKIPKNRFLCNKPIWQRIIVMAAGVINNFLLALVLLFAWALIWGSTSLEPIISKVEDNSAVLNAGIKAGDKIVAINNHKVNTWDEAQIVLYYKNDGYYEFRIEHPDGKVEDYKIMPNVVKNEDGTETKVFGIYMEAQPTKGFLNKIVYAFQKFWSLMSSLWLTIAGLVTGKISLDALSGPVGIYNVVGTGLTMKFNEWAQYTMYLVAYLSINVGFINILPFPAFDGGRIFFLIIEKIKGSPVNQQFENWCHTIGFILLMILIVLVTIKDIIRLF